jgi:hypothetical protein
MHILLRSPERLISPSSSAAATTSTLHALQICSAAIARSLLPAVLVSNTSDVCPFHCTLPPSVKSQDQNAKQQLQDPSSLLMPLASC